MAMNLEGSNGRGLVVRTKENRNAYRDLVGKHQGNRLLQDLEVDWKIILKRIFYKFDGRTWNRLICLKRKKISKLS